MATLAAAAAASSASPRAAFAIHAALAEGLYAEWRVVQVQSGWVLEKLLRHILILMGKQHEKNCSYCDRYTALLPRLHMARLTDLSNQLIPGDHVILARNHSLMPNKCFHFSQKTIPANPNHAAHEKEQQPKPEPEPVPFKTSVIWPLTCKKVVAVSCASAHTMLVTASGDLYGYGAARNGRLGRSFGNTFNHLQAAPCKIDLPPGALAIHVACGDKFTAVACRDLDLDLDLDREHEHEHEHGHEHGHEHDQVDDRDDRGHGYHDRFREHEHGVFERRGGRGANQLFTFGACGPWLGLGDCMEDVWQPELAYVSSRTSIMDISCGLEHCLFSTSSGQVYSFGVGDKGQLGQIDGPTGTLSALSRFYFLTQKELDHVWRADQAKYVALLLSGEEYARLLDSSTMADVAEGTKRIGTFLRKPVQLFRQCSSGLTGLLNEYGESLELIKEKEIRRGERRAVFTKEANGSLSSNTEIKDSEDIDAPTHDSQAQEELEWIFVLPCLQPVSRPRPVAALSGTCIRSVSAGGKHSAALSKSGQLFTFGDNAFGQLGHGIKLAHMTGYTTPVATEVTENKALAEVGVKAVACGMNHTAAISKDGRLYVWGEGSQSSDFEDLDCFRPNLLDTVSPCPITSVDAANDVTVCSDRAGKVIVVSPARPADLTPSWASTSEDVHTEPRSPPASLDVLPTDSVDYVVKVAVAGGGASEPVSGVLLSASYMDETLSAHRADSKHVMKEESTPKPGREYCAGIRLQGNCIVC